MTEENKMFYIEKLDRGYVLTHEDNKKQAILNTTDLKRKIEEILNLQLDKCINSKFSSIQISSMINIPQTVQPGY